MFVGVSGYRLAPGEFVLASTAEMFCMPDDVLGVVHDKSSWARRGLAAQNTVIEPGWRGFLTLELTNHGKEPLWLERGVGIVQVIFHLLDEPAAHPYRGKYQDQAAGPQVAR
jgi:dCTP deaminase